MINNSILYTIHTCENKAMFIHMKMKMSTEIINLWKDEAFNSFHYFKVSKKVTLIFLHTILK